MKRLNPALPVLLMILMASPAGAAEILPCGPAADNSAALLLFRQGRYAEAYAAFWPALAGGDPEAIFHGLIIRRNGLDGRQPAQPKETAALTGFLVSRAEFMRQALRARPRIPETTADAYRTALAQLVYAGLIPLERPPALPEKFSERRRQEALALISSPWARPPIGRYPPALNFAAHLNLSPGGSARKAQDLLQKSAKAEDRLGMINLSLLYREGTGGFRNDLRAAHLARRAAEAEPPLPRALNEVGFFYETGRGVTQDLAEARAWYGKSAARGYQPGRRNAARLKGGGKGTPQSRPALEETIIY